MSITVQYMKKRTLDWTLSVCPVYPLDFSIYWKVTVYSTFKYFKVKQSWLEKQPELSTDLIRSQQATVMSCQPPAWQASPLPQMRFCPEANHPHCSGSATNSHKHGQPGYRAEHGHRLPKKEQATLRQTGRVAWHVDFTLTKRIHLTQALARDWEDELEGTRCSGSEPTSLTRPTSHAWKFVRSLKHLQWNADLSHRGKNIHIGHIQRWHYVFFLKQTLLYFKRSVELLLNQLLFEHVLVKTPGKTVGIWQGSDGIQGRYCLN